MRTWARRRLPIQSRCSRCWRLIRRRTNGLRTGRCIPHVRATLKDREGAGGRGQHRLHPALAGYVEVGAWPGLASVVAGYIAHLRATLKEIQFYADRRRRRSIPHVRAPLNVHRHQFAACRCPVASRTRWATLKERKLGPEEKHQGSGREANIRAGSQSAEVPQSIVSCTVPKAVPQSDFHRVISRRHVTI